MEFECNITSNTCVTNRKDQDPLIVLHFKIAVVYITIVLLLSVVGILGSSVMLYWLASEKRIRKHPKYFLINSTVADLCVSGMANPMCIAGAIVGMGHFNTNSWLCSIIASACLTACICTFLNFTSLTVNRWICICHSQQYDKIYNRNVIILICLFCWIGGFIAEFPNFIGWGGHYFDQKSHQCIWDRTADRTYTLFVALVLLSCPFVINGYCNVAILRKLWSVKRAVSGFQNEERTKLGQNIRSSKTLIGMYMVYFVCWSPYVFMLVLDHGDTFSMEVHLFVTLLAHSHSSTTFIIYMAFNGRIRDFLYRSLGRGRRQASVAPAQGIAGSSRNIPHVNTHLAWDNDMNHLKSSKLIFSVESNRRSSTEMLKPDTSAENTILNTARNSNTYFDTSFHNPKITTPERLEIPAPGLRTIVETTFRH